MNKLEHHFIETNGVKLHVVTAGPKKGEPVLLLHGFPEYWGGWLKNIPALANAGFRVIAPDQRGYGESSVPADVEDYALLELVRDITGLMDRLGHEKVNLVGHDWGAAVAWATAMAFPGRVKRLGILNVPHPRVMLRFLLRSPRQMLRSWYIAFFQVPGLADWLLRRNDFSLAVRVLTASGKKGTFSRPELEEYKKAWSASGGMTGMLNWYRAAVQYRPPLPADVRIHVPALILWGKRDAALGFEMAGESLNLCDYGKLIFYENATHWVQHDEPEAVNRELIAFLR